MGGSSQMGSDEDKKKLNDDVVEFVGKRTGAEVPRLATRLKSYVDLQHKRQRAVAARRNYYSKKEMSTARRNTAGDQKDKTMENTDQLADDDDRDRVRRRDRHRGETRSRSEGPYDRCGRRRRRRRRRRSCRRRRRRRCGRRRRRRRRSCRRRRRRRRRRSCSRRRRRRSCHRRRRRRRRRRC